MKINCIIQARMGSTRLPGKVMKEINGKPMIGYLVERILLTTEVDKIIAVIPECDLGGPLGKFLGRYKVEIVTGPEQEVAERFRLALAEFYCDAFVRICADSPLVDPRLIDRLILRSHDLPFFVMEASEDLLGSIELVATHAFLEALPHFSEEDWEHVTSYFKRPQARRFVVDTQEDFERVSGLISRMDRPHTSYGYEECLTLQQQ